MGRAGKRNRLMTFKEKLDELYKEECETSGCPPENKFQFLGNSIFDFTTYDGAIDELFAKKMLEVIAAIVNRTTFEYQENEANYINYLTMVNMPFLQGKLEWGTSIRGAWFDEYGHHSEKEEERVYQITYDWSIPKKDINDFMKALLEWSEG